VELYRLHKQGGLERLGVTHAFAFDTDFEEFGTIIRVPCVERALEQFREVASDLGESAEKTEDKA